MVAVQGDAAAGSSAGDVFSWTYNPRGFHADAHVPALVLLGNGSFQVTRVLGLFTLRSLHTAVPCTGSGPPPCNGLQRLENLASRASCDVVASGEVVALVALRALI